MCAANHERALAPVRVNHALVLIAVIARAAIRALAPLIIERCAEVAGKEATDFKLWKNLEASYGCSVVSDAIRALIQKEASDGEV